VSDQGKEAVVAILEPGQFFGERCLNGHPLRLAATTAATWLSASLKSLGSIG
jgi:CRP/FNR family cyclic AMP-dependent transcriptional regulator